MRPNRDAVLDWVAWNVPAAVTDHLRGKLDSCVLSTRVGLDVCSYFGVEAKPVVVRAMAFNPAWARFAQKHPELLAQPGDEKWSSPEADGAWAVGIDEVDHGTKGKFPGHLILYLPGDPPEILDLSAGQFRREQHAMNIPNCISAAAPGFLDGAPVTFVADDDSTVVYAHRPGVSGYQRGGDWRHRNEITGALIRRAKQELTTTTAVA